MIKTGRGRKSRKGARFIGHSNDKKQKKKVLRAIFGRKIILFSIPYKSGIHICTVFT